MPRILRLCLSLTLVALLAGCAQAELASHVLKNGGMATSSGNVGDFKIGKPYKINGQWYYPREQYEMTETGIASWYGPGFQGKRTANGEIFDTGELTAAHRTLQMPSLVRVTNLENGRSVIVRINDRGPFKRGRVIDVSEKAADLLGFKGQGTAKVKLEVLRQESLKLAEMAKAGQSTQGYEVAMNQPGRRVPPQAAYAPPPQQPPASYQTAAVSPVARETLEAAPATPGGYTPVVPGHTRNGAFYPDPVVTEVPVTPTNIFVQAGSFASQDNAYRLSQQLNAMADSRVYPAMVNGQQFYRVRLGPLSRVNDADELLSRMIAAGHQNAIIVVE